MLTPESRLSDFPSLGEMTYLNTAAESIPPTCVHNALEEYWRDKTRGMRGRDQHFAKLEECREVAARAIGFNLNEVSFCSCSSEAYNLLAQAMKLGDRDEVVITDLDFPAGATPWLTDHARPAVAIWKSRNGGLELEDLEPLLNERTRLVQISLVSFYNGYRIRWKPFVECVRRLAPDAIISVDVTQALGRIELDLEGANCVISSTHKWALGTHGGCVVGVREDVEHQLTTHAGGWFHIANAFEANRFEKAVSNTGAASFSVGMPNFAAIYALNASLRYLERIGVPAIAAHADPLTERLCAGLADLGIELMAPRRTADESSGITAFRHPATQSIHNGFEAREVHVMHHAGRIRLAVHGYNTQADIDHCLTALKEILAELPR